METNIKMRLLYESKGKYIILYIDYTETLVKIEYKAK